VKIEDIKIKEIIFIEDYLEILDKNIICWIIKKKISLFIL
jgi:hypothetical protein